MDKYKEIHAFVVDMLTLAQYKRPKKVRSKGRNVHICIMDLKDK